MVIGATAIGPTRLVMAGGFNVFAAVGSRRAIRLARIEVDLETAGTGWEARVTVTDAGGSSSHLVKVSKSAHEKLTGGGIPPEELVRRTFEFLLAREPRESILRDFEIEVVERYFPEFGRGVIERGGRWTVTPG
jgi:hypothetical protein